MEISLGFAPLENTTIVTICMLQGIILHIVLFISQKTFQELMFPNHTQNIIQKSSDCV